jgi:hypothetical protein
MELHSTRQSIDTANWQDFSYKPIVVFNIARGCKDLYVHYFVRGMSLLALAGKDGQYVHTDSCVEFFVSHADAGAYYNFEFNCIGTCHAAYGKDRHERMQITSADYAAIRRYASVQCAPFAELMGIHQWELTIALPFAVMGLDAERLPEYVCVNFYKCADHAAHPHYLSWNPIPLPQPDFHCPQHFGRAYF